MSSRNEKTSARVAKIAAKVLAMKYSAFECDLRSISGTMRTWRNYRALAASALTQTADRERRYNPDVPQPLVDQPDGFDPREGGELEGRWRPKSLQDRKALRGKLGKRPSSPFYPAVKPKRSSP